MSATVETGSSFVVPPLPGGKVKYQQGSLPPCSGHRDDATGRVGSSGSPIGIAIKGLWVLASLPVWLFIRILAGAPTCVPPPCLPFSVSCLAVTEESRELGGFASQISCENSYEY